MREARCLRSHAQELTDYVSTLTSMSLRANVGPASTRTYVDMHEAARSPRGRCARWRGYCRGRRSGELMRSGRSCASWARASPIGRGRLTLAAPPAPDRGLRPRTPLIFDGALLRACPRVRALGPRQIVDGALSARAETAS